MSDLRVRQNHLWMALQLAQQINNLLRQLQSNVNVNPAFTKPFKIIQSLGSQWPWRWQSHRLFATHCHIALLVNLNLSRLLLVQDVTCMTVWLYVRFANEVKQSLYGFPVVTVWVLSDTDKDFLVRIDNCSVHGCVECNLLVCIYQQLFFGRRQSLLVNRSLAWLVQDVTFGNAVKPSLDFAVGTAPFSGTMTKTMTQIFWNAFFAYDYDIL